MWQHWSLYVTGRESGIAGLPPPAPPVFEQYVLADRRKVIFGQMKEVF